MLVTLGLISFLSGIFGFGKEQPETLPHYLEEDILYEDVLVEDIEVEENVTTWDNANIKYWD